MWPKYDSVFFLIRFKSCGAFTPNCSKYNGADVDAADGGGACDCNNIMIMIKVIKMIPMLAVSHASLDHPASQTPKAFDTFGSELTDLC